MGEKSEGWIIRGRDRREVAIYYRQVRKWPLRR